MKILIHKNFIRNTRIHNFIFIIFICNLFSIECFLPHQIKNVIKWKYIITKEKNENKDLESKLFMNISFNKIKTNLKDLLIVNKNFRLSDINSVTFLGKFHDYNKIENYGVNEICILGRSNVGKSTFLKNFIKYLLNINDNKNIKVSKNSGCTRSINLYSFQNKKKKLFILTDMPGIGYAKGIGIKKMNLLKKNLDDYIFLRNQICLFFILIDISVDLQKLDITLINTIKKTNIPFQIICTKSDKYKLDIKKRINAIKNCYKLNKNPIHISKYTSYNYIKIFKEIQEHCKSSDK